MLLTILPQNHLIYNRIISFQLSSCCDFPHHSHLLTRSIRFRSRHLRRPFHSRCLLFLSCWSSAFTRSRCYPCFSWDRTTSPSVGRSPLGGWFLESTLRVSFWWIYPLFLNATQPPFVCSCSRSSCSKFSSYASPGTFQLWVCALSLFLSGLLPLKAPSHTIREFLVPWVLQQGHAGSKNGN